MMRMTVESFLNHFIWLMSYGTRGGGGMNKAVINWTTLGVALENNVEQAILGQINLMMGEKTRHGIKDMLAED